MQFLNGNQTDSSTQHRVKNQSTITANTKAVLQGSRAILLRVFEHLQQKRLLWGISFLMERDFSSQSLMKTQITELSLALCKKKVLAT